MKQKNNCTIHLPIDVNCIKNDDEKVIYTRDIYNIPNNEMGLDISKILFFLKNYM